MKLSNTACLLHPGSYPIRRIVQARTFISELFNVTKKEFVTFESFAGQLISFDGYHIHGIFFSIAMVIIIMMYYNKQHSLELKWNTIINYKSNTRKWRNILVSLFYIFTHDIDNAI